MYCSNCGRENRQGDSFCVGCGVPLSTNVNNVVQNTIVNNHQVNKEVDVNNFFLKFVKCFFSVGGIAFLVCVIAIIWSLFVVVNNVSDNHYIEAQQNHYVYFDDVKIPTIYHLIKEYNMCLEPELYFHSGREDIEYFYCDDYIDSNVFTEYAELLINDYGFEKVESMDDRIVLVNSFLEEKYNMQVTIFLFRESVEYAKVIKVNLNEEDNSL